MKTLDIWIDISMREMRETYRDMFNAWAGNDVNGIIEEAKELQSKLKSFIDFLERKKKSDDLISDERR